MKNLKQNDFDDCLKRGLLRRDIPPSEEKARESLFAAEKWLKEAENNLNSESFNSSVMASYLAMFHAARAILFFDGFREKSHYCIARYLEEKYVRIGLLEIKWINLLDHCRELRHNDQYSLSFFASQGEAEETYDKSKEFVERMHHLVENLIHKRKA